MADPFSQCPCERVHEPGQHQDIGPHIPEAALDDYNTAIAIMAQLRAELEPQGEWPVSFRNDLAGAYMNQGNAKHEAPGYGPSAAIDSYDAGIAIMEALRAD